MCRPQTAAAGMLKTPAHLLFTFTALCAFAAGSIIYFVCTNFIASFLNSEAVRPQGFMAAIAPRARRGNLVSSAPMTSGIDNMCCGIITIQQVAVDVDGPPRPSDKVDCNSGAAPVNRWVFICVGWHRGTSLSGKGIGAVSCAPSEEHTSQSASVFVCIRRGADGLPSNVHLGRCSLVAPTRMRLVRPRMSILRRPSASGAPKSDRQTRPPGARLYTT